MASISEINRSYITLRTVLPILFFILLAETVGAVSGFLFQPGDWYETLAKPFFNPPAWVFGPVWTLLFVMIGIAGGLVWRPAPQSTAMRLWFGQMFLNAFWTCAFFYLQSPSLALAVIAGLLMTIAAFMKTAFDINRLASWLFAPYLAWVAFASVLNLSIVYLN